MTSPECGRFAPSPTGELHLGGARTALVAWLSARSKRGNFLVRMEDLDRPRVIPGAEQRILDDLRWLGLDWDGPVVRQSERIDLYERALSQLDTFACWCSRADLAASAPHGDEGPRYPGTCRGRAPAAKPASRRVRVEPGAIDWIDLVHGPRRDHPSQQVGDFVVRRADGVFTYQLAVIVDDAAQGVTEVVRGDDLLSSTARQIHLYRALGLAVPKFAHVPLLLGPDGQRLSKRHGSIAVRALGDPRAIIGKLAGTLGFSSAPAWPGDLLAQFSLEKLPREPTKIDPKNF
jgi:glutamyl-tRNA synthetase